MAPVRVTMGLIGRSTRFTLQTLHLEKNRFKLTGRFVNCRKVVALTRKQVNKQLNVVNENLVLLFA